MVLHHPLVLDKLSPQRQFIVEHVLYHIFIDTVHYC